MSDQRELERYREMARWQDAAGWQECASATRDRLTAVTSERDALAAQLAAIRGPHSPRTNGMLISLPGVLDRAAEALRRDEDAAYLAEPLGMLLAHLRELRADPTRAGEFFSLWVDSEGTERSEA